MVTTSRKFELIIRSRASASPFLIFPASSTSCCGVKRGIRPISRRYLFSPVSLLFMTGTYSTERIRRYCARVGFSNNTREVIGAPPFEIEFGAERYALCIALTVSGSLGTAGTTSRILPKLVRSNDHVRMKFWAWDKKDLPSITHSIRTAVAVTVSVIIARPMQMPEAYWAAIATLIVIQSTFGATLTLSIGRIVATAVGASVGALEANYFRANLVAFAVAIFLVGLLPIAFRLEKTAYRYASITLTIIVLIPRSGAPWMIALHRFLEVSVGIIVALAVVALWPEHRRLSSNSAAE